MTLPDTPRLARLQEEIICPTCGDNNRCGDEWHGPDLSQSLAAAEARATELEAEYAEYRTLSVEDTTALEQKLAEAEARAEAAEQQVADGKQAFESSNDHVGLLQVDLDIAEAALLLLRQGLQTYGQHHGKCAAEPRDYMGSLGPTGEPCTCGLSTLLEGEP